MSDPISTGLTIWGVMAAGFAAVLAGLGHLHQRINATDATAEKRARDGDNSIWSAMERRHAENQQALAAARQEAHEAHSQLIGELHAMRMAIDQDRRVQIEQLLAEIRELKARGHESG